MKKLFALILSASMLVALASCSNPDKTEYTSSPLTKETGSEADAGGIADAGKNTAGADVVTLLPGELYQFDKDTDGGPVIKGITLKGNCLGSSEFNDKAPDVKGIRCFFELNEWIEFYPETNGTDSLWIYVFKHADDAKVYTEMGYTEEDPKVLATCTLLKPEEAGDQWGSFYLNPDYADPGVYDIVFVKDGKAVAVMEARFAEAGSVGDVSDDALRDMMKDF